MKEIQRKVYLDRLISRRENGVIKIITGIRRCGKSYLLDPIFKNYLIQSGVREDHIIKLELDKEENKKYRDSHVLNEYIKSLIKDINPFVKIKTKDIFVTKENIDFLKEYDIVIEAFDDPKNKAMICNTVLRNFKDKYLIASSGMAGYYDSNIIKTKKIRDKFYICGDFEHEAKEGEGLMAPRVSICANHMANLAMKILIEDIKR